MCDFFFKGVLQREREYGIIYASPDGVDLKGGYSSRSVWWVKRRMEADTKNQHLSVLFNLQLQSDRPAKSEKFQERRHDAEVRMCVSSLCVSF